jgi:hyaluronoglucosaminidase
LRYLGIIEGFYGTSWSWSARRDYPQFMANVGLNAYIYAPKSDAKLRANWSEPWSDTEISALQQCARDFQQRGMTFGIGISPIGLCDASQGDSGAKARQNALAQLDHKLDQIASISTDLLCILFDDVPSSGDQMASMQLALCERIRARAKTKKVIVCPSYYTTDPVLEKLFGPRPADYWRALGSGLDSDIDFFWTGEQVCSATYSEDNLQLIAEQLRRPPVLWDNYPVNDGAKLSRHLHLKAFSGQPFLTELTAGHFANPMNQPYLSQLPLATLAFQYTQMSEDHASHAGAYVNVDSYWRQVAKQQMGESLAADLLADIERFQTQGLDEISINDKALLIKKYSHYSSVYAEEVVAWLEEQYRFDPACLTG